MDCTRTALFGGISGVPRVTRAFFNHLPTQLQAAEISCLPVVWTGNHYVAINGQLSQNGSRWTRFLKALKSQISTSLPVSKGQETKALSRHSEVLMTLSYRFSQKIDLDDSDWVLLLDPSWNMLRPLEAIKRSDARSILFLHDLIPITSQETCDVGVSEQFERWLQIVLPLANAAITVSAYTKNKLIELFKPECLCNSIQLGTDIHSRSQSTQHARYERLALPDEFFLAVGTVEPRKRHVEIIRALRVAAGSEHQPQLVLIGRWGWINPSERQEIEQAIRDGLVIHFDQANDAIVRSAYQSARCLITSSSEEGFGLPIIEARAMGLPVIATDIPAHREAGGDATTFYPPGDVHTLAKRIQNPPSVVVGNDLLLTWEQSSQQLCDTLINIIRSQG
jgi:glycosyltransferase involved in cell wall biosynthesis